MDGGGREKDSKILCVEVFLNPFLPHFIPISAGGKIYAGSKFSFCCPIRFFDDGFRQRRINGL